MRRMQSGGNSCQSSSVGGVHPYQLIQTIHSFWFLISGVKVVSCFTVVRNPGMQKRSACRAMKYSWWDTSRTRHICNRNRQNIQWLGLYIYIICRLLCMHLEEAPRMWSSLSQCRAGALQTSHSTTGSDCCHVTGCKAWLRSTRRQCCHGSWSDWCPPSWVLRTNEGSWREQFREPLRERTQTSIVNRFVSNLIRRNAVRKCSASSFQILLCTSAHPHALDGSGDLRFQFSKSHSPHQKNSKEIFRNGSEIIEKLENVSFFYPQFARHLVISGALTWDVSKKAISRDCKWCHWGAPSTIAQSVKSFGHKIAYTG